MAILLFQSTKKIRNIVYEISYYKTFIMVDSFLYRHWPMTLFECCGFKYYFFLFYGKRQGKREATGQLPAFKVERDALFEGTQFVFTSSSQLMHIKLIMPICLENSICLWLNNGNVVAQWQSFWLESRRLWARFPLREYNYFHFLNVVTRQCAALWSGFDISSLVPLRS